jgi:hypothetical protein
MQKSCSSYKPWLERTRHYSAPQFVEGCLVVEGHTIPPNMGKSSIVHDSKICGYIRDLKVESEPCLIKSVRWDDVIEERKENCLVFCAITAPNTVLIIHWNTTCRNLTCSISSSQASSMISMNEEAIPFSSVKAPTTLIMDFTTMALNTISVLRWWTWKFPSIFLNLRSWSKDAWYLWS